MVTSPDRERFRFAEVVQGPFGFLADHGFRCSEASAELVRYRSGELEITLSHDRYAYEVCLFGRSDRVPGTFEMHTLLIALGFPGRTSEIHIAGSTPERVRESIERYARLTRECLVPLLSHDPDAIASVVATSVRQVADYRDRMQFERIRKEVAAAWADGDHFSVVRLLDELGRSTALTRSEAKRLEISRSKVQGS